MENSTQNQGNKAMPQYPQAGDELQKHIETVVPESEKEHAPEANAAPEDTGATKREEGAVKLTAVESKDQSSKTKEQGGEDESKAESLKTKENDADTQSKAEHEASGVEEADGNDDVESEDQNAEAKAQKEESKVDDASKPEAATKTDDGVETVDKIS